MKPIGIIDYGMGNLWSVKTALEFLQLPSQVVSTPAEILSAGRLILPGVGSFGAAMGNIRGSGLAEAIDRSVREQGKLLLGICLGMQLLAEWGDEDGPTAGLGYIKGKVKHFEGDLGLPVPHVGFNSVRKVGEDRLAGGLGPETEYYFVHSYRMECADEGDVVGWCHYGKEFAASIQRDNVLGTQFHPEKSQTNGLKLLRNFGRLPD